MFYCINHAATRSGRSLRQATALGENFRRARNCDRGPATSDSVPGNVSPISYRSEIFKMRLTAVRAQRHAAVPDKTLQTGVGAIAGSVFWRATTGQRGAGKK